jgi:hypothetical protein
MKIEAGYHKGPYGEIFSGNIDQQRRGKLNGTDTYHDALGSSGGNAYTQAVVRETIPKGATLMDAFQKIFQPMKEKGVKQGHIPTDALQRELPNGWTLMGMSKDLMRTLAETIGASWTIQNNEFRMTEYNKSLPGKFFDISATNGLIGIPEQTAHRHRGQDLDQPGHQGPSANQDRPKDRQEIPEHPGGLGRHQPQDRGRSPARDLRGGDLQGGQGGPRRLHEGPGVVHHPDLPGPWPGGPGRGGRKQPDWWGQKLARGPAERRRGRGLRRKSVTPTSRREAWQVEQAEEMVASPCRTPERSSTTSGR